MKHVLALCVLLAPLSPAAARATDNPRIVQPTNGDTVGSPVTVEIGGMDMAGGRVGHPHLHLFSDAPPPVPGKMVPMDAHHVHLTHGETKAIVRLPPGSHTIQLFEGSGSHAIAANAPHSDPVTFQVR